MLRQDTLLLQFTLLSPLVAYVSKASCRPPAVWQQATQCTSERSRYFRHAIGGQRDDFLAKGHLFTDLGTRLNTDLGIRNRGARTDATCNPGIPPPIQNRPSCGAFYPHAVM